MRYIVPPKYCIAFVCLTLISLPSSNADIETLSSSPAGQGTRLTQQCTRLPLSISSTGQTEQPPSFIAAGNLFGEQQLSLLSAEVNTHLSVLGQVGLAKRQHVFSRDSMERAQSL